MNYQPPPFVQAIQYHDIKQINENGKRVYHTPSGTTPSVTTIISKTKDMTGLNAWKKRVGEDEARRIVTEASGVGTAMHNKTIYVIGFVNLFYIKHITLWKPCKPCICYRFLIFNTIFHFMSFIRTKW